MSGVGGGVGFPTTMFEFPTESSISAIISSNNLWRRALVSNDLKKDFS